MFQGEGARPPHLSVFVRARPSAPVRYIVRMATPLFGDRCAGEAGGGSKGAKGQPCRLSAFIRLFRAHQRPCYNTRVTVALGCPSPALLTAITR
jgi:hypothetical protein